MVISSGKKYKQIKVICQVYPAFFILEFDATEIVSISLFIYFLLFLCCEYTCIVLYIDLQGRSIHVYQAT